jgi:hypothetical protein
VGEYRLVGAKAVATAAKSRTTVPQVREKDMMLDPTKNEKRQRRKVLHQSTCSMQNKSLNTPVFLGREVAVGDE